MDYDALNKLHPKEVEEALKNFRKSKSKFKKLDIQDLEFGYGSALKAKAYSFSDFLHGKVSKEPSDKYDIATNTVAWIYCAPKCSKNVASASASLSVIPFHLFSIYFPTNSEREYKAFLNLKNFK